MKKIIERIIVFVVGLPLIIGSVYFLPYQHFLVLHLEIFIVTALSIIEIRAMFSRKIAMYSTPVVLCAGLIAPIATYLYAAGLFSRIEMIATGIGALYFIFFVETFYSFSKPFEKSIQRVCSAVFVIFYPGLLIIFISAMTRWPSASNIIAVFLLMVFSIRSKSSADTSVLISFSVMVFTASFLRTRSGRRKRSRPRQAPPPSSPPRRCRHQRLE